MPEVTLMDEIEQAISEIDWYARRQTNLGKLIDRGSASDPGKIWADALKEDIASLRGLIAKLKAAPNQALEALEAAARLHREALPKFNWGASALDGNAITLLNEVPGQVAAAIKTLKSI